MPPRQDTLLGLVLGVRPLLLAKWIFFQPHQRHSICWNKKVAIYNTLEHLVLPLHM